MHVNIFETKSDEELSVLYGQFLEAEKKYLVFQMITNWEKLKKNMKKISEQILH